MNISTLEDGITVKQNEYRNSLDEIQIGAKEIPDRELNSDEYKQFRGMVGRYSGSVKAQDRIWLLTLKL